MSIRVRYNYMRQEHDVNDKLWWRILSYCPDEEGQRRKLSVGCEMVVGIYLSSFGRGWSYLRCDRDGRSRPIFVNEPQVEKVRKVNNCR